MLTSKETEQLRFTFNKLHKEDKESPEDLVDLVDRKISPASIYSFMNGTVRTPWPKTMDALINIATSKGLWPPATDAEHDEVHKIMITAEDDDSTSRFMDKMHTINGIMSLTTIDDTRKMNSLKELFPALKDL